MKRGSILVAGIDIGAATAKAVILRKNKMENKNFNKKLDDIIRKMKDHKIIEKMARKMADEIYDDYRIKVWYWKSPVWGFCHCMN